VHALPELVVPVRGQLAPGDQSREDVQFEALGVAADEVEDRRLEHEEPTVNPPLADLRLLGERADEVAVELQAAEARRGADGGDSRQLPRLAVAANECL